MLRRIVAVMGLSMLFASCAQGSRRVVQRRHDSLRQQAKARFHCFESDEPGVASIGPADRFVYSHENNLRVPQKITLVWTAKGEEVEPRAMFTLRTQIPSHVFQLIASRKRPPHSLWLDFRVINGRPECGWKLARIDGEGVGGTELEAGVVAGEILL